MRIARRTVPILEQVLLWALAAFVLAAFVFVVLSRHAHAQATTSTAGTTPCVISTPNCIVGNGGQLFVIAFLIGNGTVEIRSTASPDGNQLYQSIEQCEGDKARLYPNDAAAVCLEVTPSYPSR